MLQKNARTSGDAEISKQSILRQQLKKKAIGQNNKT